MYCKSIEMADPPAVLYLPDHCHELIAYRVGWSLKLPEETCRNVSPEPFGPPLGTFTIALENSSLTQSWVVPFWKSSIWGKVIANAQIGASANTASAATDHMGQRRRK